MNPVRIPVFSYLKTDARKRNEAMERVIRGLVGHGKELGRTLGFPTANVESGLAFSQDLEGVWAGWAETGEERLPCIVNVGRHPTFPEGPATVEAHIIGYSGDLYGQMMTLRLTEFLRPQMKFGSGEALARQLSRDVQTALSLLTPKGKEG